MTNRRTYLILVGLILAALAGVAALGIPGAGAFLRLAIFGAGGSESHGNCGLRIFRAGSAAGGIGPLHDPQRPVSARCSGGMRLAVPQAGHLRTSASLRRSTVTVSPGG